jgi:hypothetical protein
MAIKAKGDSEKGRKNQGPKKRTEVPDHDFTLNKVGRDFTIARMNESMGWHFIATSACPII